jgi:hypothetical protein
MISLFSRSCLVAGTATEQVLQLNNERFMVSEALFHPTDIGLNQAGKQMLTMWAMVPVC